MKKLSLIKVTFVVFLTAMLAACGGGGTSIPAVAWASPAVFVPPGTADKIFALSCTKVTTVNTVTYVESQVIITTETTRDQLYTTTLKISANGDTVVSAATSATGTISVLQSIALADANEYSWNVNGTIQTPTYSMSVRQSGSNPSKSLNIYISGESYVLSLPTETTYGGDYDATTQYECTMTDPLALQINVDAARAAKNLGAEAGVTTFDDDDTTGRIEGGQVFWLNKSGSEEFSYLRFNLGSGDLASSASSTGTYSPISLSLPASNSEYGVYGESLIKNDSFFGFKDAKSICLGKESQTSGFYLSATAYGNKFRPSSDRRLMMPRGLETPRDVFGPSGCFGYDT